VAEYVTSESHQKENNMLHAVGTKLVVERIEQEQKSASGILLTNMQDPNPLAQVLSIGDQVKIAVAVGDKVAVSWNNTAQQKSQGKTFYIVDETGIFAVEK
jgi:co-chaperonin GroES (HSP10)